MTSPEAGTFEMSSGLAAYQRVASDVRVVHELLLDSRLECRDAGRVIDALLASLELAAYDDHLSCLMSPSAGACR
jgi:hypothetical protein